MTNYKELSDYEVDKAVAELKDSVQELPDGREITPSYTKDWQLAGELLEEFGMRLEKYNRKWMTITWRQKNTESGSWQVAVHSFDENPCRAIAECYLMVKEGE